MSLSSKTFAQAAKIAEQIESLQTKLSVFAPGSRTDRAKAEQSKGSDHSKSINETQNRFAKKGGLQLLTVPVTEEERYDQLWSRY